MATFIKIADAAGTGSSTIMTFNTIPATYTDLMLVVSASSTAATNFTYANISFNGVTTNLSNRRLAGYNNTSVVSDNDTVISFALNGTNAASTAGNTAIYIPNYAGSTNKSVSVDQASEYNGGGNLLGITAGLWSSTAAITSITLTTQSGNFSNYSTATLYGIKNS